MRIKFLHTVFCTWYSFGLLFLYPGVTALLSSEADISGMGALSEEQKESYWPADNGRVDRVDKSLSALISNLELGW